MRIRFQNCQFNVKIISNSIFEYFYHDNPQAKKVLQETMDKALFGASNQMQNMKKRTYDETPVNGGGANIETVKKARLADGEEQRSKKYIL